MHLDVWNSGSEFIRVPTREFELVKEDSYFQLFKQFYDLHHESVESIYLRGSASLVDHKYDPVDIDFVIVFKDGVDIKLFNRFVFSDTRIDCALVCISEFLNSDGCLLLRLLVHRSSVLIFGSDLKPTLSLVKANKESIVSIINIYYSNLRKIISRSDAVGLPSVQKLVIRLCGAIAFLRTGQFSRDLSTCVKLSQVFIDHFDVIELLDRVFLDYIGKRDSSPTTILNLLNKISKIDDLNGTHVAERGFFVDNDYNYNFMNLFGSNPDHFFEHIWDQKPALLRVDQHPNCFNGVSHDVIWQLYLAEAEFNQNFVTYSKSEPKRVDGRNRIDALIASGLTIEALDELTSKETLIIRNVNTLPKFDSFFNMMTRFWRTEGTLNCYLSSQGSDRFPLHQDAHQIFAYQSYGRKKWLLWPPTIQWPISNLQWRKENDSPTEDPIEIICDEHDVLYIPIGWRHKTENISNHSVHFSIGVKPLRWNEVLHKMLDYSISKHWPLRGYLPFEIDTDRITYLDCREELGDIKSILDMDFTNQVNAIHEYMDHLKMKR